MGAWPDDPFGADGDPYGGGHTGPGGPGELDDLTASGDDPLGGHDGFGGHSEFPSGDDPAGDHGYHGYQVTPDTDPDALGGHDVTPYDPTPHDAAFHDSTHDIAHGAGDDADPTAYGHDASGHGEEVAGEHTETFDADDGDAGAVHDVELPQPVDADTFPPHLDLDVMPSDGQDWVNVDLLGSPETLAGGDGPVAYDPPHALLADLHRLDGGDGPAAWSAVGGPDDPVIRALALHWQPAT